MTIPTERPLFFAKELQYHLKQITGAKVVSDTSAVDRWLVRVAIPLENLLPDGVKPGEKFYLNILRATAARNAVTWMPTFPGAQATMGAFCMDP